MLNLENLNYLNQNQTIRTNSQANPSSKNEDLKLNNKDFKSYLTKEKDINNKNIIEKPEEKKVTVEEKEETQPLNINKEVSEKINENLETIEGEDSKGNIEEVLLTLTSLFNNVNLEDTNLENVDFKSIDVEDIDGLLISSFDELKSIIFNNSNVNKENTDLLNMINISNGDITNVESKGYKDLLININELLNEAVKIIDGNEGITSDISLGKVENELKSSIAELFNTLDSDEFKNVMSEVGEDGKSNLLNTLKTLLNNEKNKETSSKEFPLLAKEGSIEVNNLFKNEASQKNSSESFEDSYLKEEKVLSKVINNTSENKFTNVLTTSYDRFNNITTKIEQVPVYKETMNADIIQNVKYMVTNKLEELTVKIYPKELGEITIKILSEEGIIRADIKATSKETYALLNSNIQDIKNSLSNQNIKIQEVNIGLYNEDTTFFSNGEGNSQEAEKGKYPNSKIGNIDSIEDIAEADLSNNSVNMLA